MYFHYLVIISPWKRAGRGPSLEQTWILFYQWCIVPSLVEIGPEVLEKKIFYIINVFSLFRDYLPLEKGGTLIWTYLNTLYPRMLCAKFGWNWPSGSGEEDENVKSLRQQQRRRRTTDKFWPEKLTWAFGSGEPKTHLCNGTLPIVCLSDQQINPQILIKILYMIHVFWGLIRISFIKEKFLIYQHWNLNISL